MICLFLWQASVYSVLAKGSETKSVTNENKTMTLVIQRGDTLWDLSQKYQTTVNELVRLNQLYSPDQIREGQLITIPKQEPTVKTYDSYPMNEIVTMEVPYPRYTMPNTDDVSELETVSDMAWWEIVLQKISIFATIDKGSVTSMSNKLQPSQPDPETRVNKDLVNEDTESTQRFSTGELTGLNEDRSQLVANKSVSNTTSENQIHSRSLGRIATPEEIELLSRVIHAEARGENFEGQVAVGAVVLNRLKDTRFPQTISAVVYQSGAFTAVNDKQINLTPNQQSYQAAEAALSGLDPTNGAIFYYNPRIATDQWIKSRTVIKHIGNHTFSI